MFFNALTSFFASLENIMVAAEKVTVTTVATESDLTQLKADITAAKEIKDLIRSSR